MNLIARVSWLQKMYNYLYSRVTGAVRTVNGTAPDADGNVNVSGGGGGTLQSVTDGTGNNITSNAIQVTGVDNIDTTTPSMILAASGVQGLLYFVHPIEGSPFGALAVVFNSDSNTISFQPDSLTLYDKNRAGTNNGACAIFNGKVGAEDAINLNELVTLRQVQSVVDHPYKGGQSSFTADGTTTIFDITHNLGATPSYFSLTTTQPIAQNLLGRTITLPDANTMRLTFDFAPNPGEDANYVWIVYK